MRYFTRGWASGELSDDVSDQAKEAYHARVAEITPRLPPAMVRLVHEISVHDGIIEQVIWNSHLNRLQLTIVCTDAYQNYIQAQLTYSGAMLGSSRIESLQRAALSRETELLYDEVDIDDDSVFSHRLLFDPCEEVTIDFKKLELVVSPRADQRVHLGRAFIVEGPEELA
ncbi:DUF4085 family protein [Anaeromyxobacter oryzisoli]|uniref:DUF4085 family protein n=1 Tax=Anaeromyxobacter oryzisoli TaxID=2925408 RepID=UPI001F57BF24|nr:DUF4085 family protein [Anaeromyxobacter sp. SG63]